MPRSALPTVDIAMATYNGAPYLDDMLDSIAAQTHSNMRLFVSDDGSSDGTLAVIARHAGALDITQLPSTPRKGVLRNFETALAATSAPYVALCDQDDFWLPDKLALLQSRLSDLEALHGRDFPLLVFSDIEVVDSRLARLKPSMYQQSIKSAGARTFADYFFSSHVPGCAMMVNRALLDLALPFPAVEIHDWWLIQLATLFGKIDYVDRPLIKYRQHAGNAIGLGGAAGNPWLGRLQKLASPLTFLDKRRTKWRQQVVAIRKALLALDGFGPALPETGRHFVEAGLTHPDAARLKRLLAGAKAGEWPLDQRAIIHLLGRPG